MLAALGGKRTDGSDRLHFTDEETEAARVSGLLKDTMSKESELPSDSSKLHVLPLACTTTVLHVPSQKELGPCADLALESTNFSPA